MMYKKVMPLPITELLSTTDRGLWVRVAQTGQLAWLPRSQTQLSPGMATVPEWLAKKLLKSDDIPTTTGRKQIAE